ncbi:MAG TPA: hypothetical protein DCG69_03125 [Bacteroidales bacterium]|nr:hypothetical protein [Bacteroidales bacterium]
MKRLLLLITVVLLFISTSAFSQNPLSVGRSQINLGVGLSEWGVPFYIGFDYGIHPDITIGGELSFRAYREDYENIYYNHGVIGISGNGNYHFNTLLQIPQNWDFYAGLNLGFYVWTSPTDYPGDQASIIGIGGQIGGRYFFTDRFGLNLELGSGNAFSGGKFGVTIKL